jgi:hypothetical protein
MNPESKAGVQGKAIHAALRRQHGYGGSYSSVARMLVALRGQQPVASTVRLSFEPGEAAQVDFGAGPVFMHPDGRPRRAWAFVMTLAHSRHQYVEFVWDQTVATWLGCHLRAFEWYRAPCAASPNHAGRSGATRAPSGRPPTATSSTAEYAHVYRLPAQRSGGVRHRDELHRRRRLRTPPSGRTNSESGPREQPVRGHYVSDSTGTGKTWLACALARQAARCGFTVLYARTTRLMTELRVAHGDGSFGRRLAQLARIDVLVLDDFAGAPMDAGERTDLLELLDDRVGTKATLITSQMAVNKWHAWLDDPTVADAILDRIVHCSHRIALKGPSFAQGRAAGGRPMIASRMNEHASDGALNTACPPRRSFVASDARRRGHTWTPPVCKALSRSWQAGRGCRHTSDLQSRDALRP